MMQNDSRHYALADSVIRFVDMIIKPMVVISIVMYLLELEMSIRYD